MANKCESCKKDCKDDPNCFKKNSKTFCCAKCSEKYEKGHKVRVCEFC